MTEAEEQAMFDKMVALRAAPPCRVRLTDRCKGFLRGLVWKTTGDEVELSVPEAQALCDKGHAEPVGPAAWFKKFVAAIRPAPEGPPRLDKPGPGRSYRGRMRPGKSYWYAAGLESYGDDRDIWIDEDTARVLANARQFQPIEPNYIPPAPETPVKPTWPTNQWGCSPMVGPPLGQPEH